MKMILYVVSMESLYCSNTGPSTIPPLKHLSVVLTFESVDKILKCDYSNCSYREVLSHGTVLFFDILLNDFCKNFPCFDLGHSWRSKSCQYCSIDLVIKTRYLRILKKNFRSKKLYCFLILFSLICVI